MRTVIAALILTTLSLATTHADEAKKPSLPPRYMSAVATYDTHLRFVALLTGKTFFLSCKEALEDTQTAIAKATELAPLGSRAVGMCLPIPTYSYDDLIPQPDDTKPAVEPDVHPSTVI